MKSIEVMHGSFAAYAGVLAVAVLVAAVLALSGPRARRHLARLGKCAIAGAAAAAALVWYVDAKRHAQLAAQAAQPANGHQLTAANVLADGFAATFLTVTVLAFALATLASRRRPPAPVRVSARPRAGTRTWPS